MATIITFLFGYIPLLAMYGFALWLLSRLLKSIFSSISAPIISQEARIISRRQQTAKGITYPFATFEFNDGSRRELVIVNGDYGILKEGDTGTVRYKGRYYKGFVRHANSSQTPQYVNTTNRQATTYTQNQSTDHQQNQDKLQLGLQRLSKAGSDPDMLGLALISLHGALEDYFRNWLSTNSSVSHSEREAVLDTAQVQWKGLLDLMQQYGGLNNNQRQYIFRMNRLRQDVGHGNQFAGTRSELENYADFVRGFIANGSP